MAAFSKFTERARKVILLAKEESKRVNHEYIGTEHVLLGLVKEGEGVAAAVLNSLGLDAENIRNEVEKLVQPGPTPVMNTDIPFTPKAKKVIELAMDEARNLGHNYIGTEHLLLGLIREGDGVAAQVLLNTGLDLKSVRDEVLNLLGSSVPGYSTTPDAKRNKRKTKTPALDSFARDLTEMAKEDKLDPVIGRDKEIQRVVQILGRRKKNNPVLIGEAGVGKTAIVEGLAQKIVAGDIPEILKKKRVLILDLASMIAGTKYRGQFEERIKAVMKEIKSSSEVIVFIDEIHTLVGAGGAEGAIDASNMLKPSLQRGDIQCIGATTFDEYRKTIEKDPALERRFQPVIVDAPSVEDTIGILKGLRDKYEAHHNVKFTDSALSAAAKLSDRYISARFQPDKSIDLMDESGSRARLSTMIMPTDLKQEEIKIEEYKREKEEAVKNQDFEKAARFRDLEKKGKDELDEKQVEWRKRQNQQEVLVDEEDIATVVSEWTGIPLVKVEEKESEKYLKLEKNLKERVIGQDEAISAIAHAVRRSRAGIKDPNRPIGTFVFLGPTGVGKTLLGKKLAEIIFGNEDAIIQVDMSEYMEKFNVSKLVGAPPGYVGYDEGGQLTEKVRRKPYAVVLLDEIEKAHPDIFNILLQLLDEGRLTDSYGRKVSFKHTILIMTSNIGADLLKKTGAIGFQNPKDSDSYSDMKGRLLEEVKKTFKPEFLNRIDDVIVFHGLTREDMDRIVDIEVFESASRLKEQNIVVTLDRAAKDFLIAKGFNKAFGARPLKRAIQKYLENPLAEEILSNAFEKGSKIRVTADPAAEALQFIDEVNENSKK
ncbi:MAG: ATP-dependent Clp protease ATP-binding subunit [Candidatus Omnitrophica bacterium]|nr:ATP-dependent Clp protease ATP-binding subunit [Candidatus Omnitrophota bacterium]MBU1128419.1 ATP-dependent Clp protease ATP-binding subunit [Candidatus Omnitrophota bacterium]MBU1784758.1 ATP-dependent Clp protease ATP-binding subunit [Candidatus Omnitrophota bacterium]MBU1852299.1 ATP-dependent Clp protease ATP-binding subunit [Candidatus Omnitrophota bacterium]